MGLDVGCGGWKCRKSDVRIGQKAVIRSNQPCVLSAIDREANLRFDDLPVDQRFHKTDVTEDNMLNPFETLPKSVVFDEPLARAFLSMARQEKLIEDSPELTDHWLEHFTRDEPSDAVKRLVLEQITMTPTVVWPHWMPENGVRGKLVEEQILVRPGTERSTPPSAQEMSADWVVNMLAARGMSMTSEKVVQLNSDVVLAEQACQRIEEARGQAFPNKIARIAREVIYRNQKVNWHPFTDEEMAVRYHLESAIEAWRPIRSCIEAFALTVSTAEDSGALVRLPFDIPSEVESAKLTKLDAHERGNHALLAIVSNDLGRTPFRPTLRETLKLANDPATVALRQQLAIWKKALETGDERSLARIHSDISTALRGLQWAGSFSEFSRWMTVLSVPVGSLGFFVSGVPGTLPGVGVSVVGMLAQETAGALRGKYQWAMFGNN